MRKFKQVGLFIICIALLSACSQKPEIRPEIQLSPEQVKEQERLDKIKKPRKLNESTAKEHRFRK